MNGDELRVSVVDDDQSVLRAVRRLLQSAGFSVQVFASAEEFLARGEDASSGCLVLDLHLGGLSGFELCERLIASGRRIPTVLMTAHDDAAIRDRALHAGLVEYLRKPFDDHALIDAIHRTVARHAGRGEGSG